MGLAEQFKDELELIKKAKLTFIIGFLVLAILIASSEYAFIFKEWLARKDDAISTLKQQLENAKADSGEKTSHNKSQAIGQERDVSTGPASATGTGVVANSGNSATVQNEILKPGEHNGKKSRQ